MRERDIAGEWWKLFKSPGLNALIERSLKANPTLDAAVAALRIANENVYAQEGKYFPLIQANYTPTRQQIAGQLGPTLTSGATLFNLHTAQVLVSYTLDVWGLNRRTVESLQAQAESQRFLAEAAYLTLISNVVAGAVQEASLRAQIATTRDLIGINSKMLDVLRQQLATGYENRVDVAAQESQLAQVQATLPPLQKQLAQQRDLLTALAGRFPSEEPPEKFELAALRLPRDLPVSLPSKLIEQRPDVRSAEALLHSASAQVGVAVANMLPALTISATGGYTAAVLPGLISPANEFWTLAGSATQPVFDGFTLLHQKRAAEDAYDQAAAQYRSTVIGALQNVADTLRALQADADALKAAVEFEHAADVSLTLIRQQMQSGYSNVLLLLTAEQALLQARLTVIQARASRLADTVALYQALGGGWWNRTDVASEKPLELIPIKPVAVSAKPRDVGSLRSADGASARRLAITAGRPVALLRRPGVWRSGSDVAMADAGDVVPKQPVDVVAQEYRDAAADQAGDDALADAINAALVDRAAGAATDQPPGGDFANRRALAWQLPADVAAARPLSSAGRRD